jgi:triphosphoribosyl-dephospho-CoA synthase
MTLNLKALFKAACLDELQAMKPGNVHIFADGHDMTIHDFIASAEAASQAIAEQGLTLGERIFNAVEATQNAVHCNTNLGIILLCAPLIHASQNPHKISLAEQLKNVLKNTTRADAEHCFKAIALANPAGLGESAQHDVHCVPDCTLLEAMQVAEMRDLIARQFCNEFADILEFGQKHYAQAMARWQNNSWAASYVYLSFLANYLDSHIVRKYGETIAKEVQHEAMAHMSVFADIENPKTYLGELLRWDTDLKARRINPGTCADLTVATLFAIKLKAASSSENKGQA